MDTSSARASFLILLEGNVSHAPLDIRNVRPMQIGTLREVLLRPVRTLCAVSVPLGQNV